MNIQCWYILYLHLWAGAGTWPCSRRTASTPSTGAAGTGCSRCGGYLDSRWWSVDLGDQAEHAEEALAKLNHSYIAHLWGSHSRGQEISLDRVSQFWLDYSKYRQQIEKLYKSYKYCQHMNAGPITLELCVIKCSYIQNSPGWFPSWAA